MDHRERDSYRPRYNADPGPPSPMPAAVQSTMYHFQGNADQGGSHNGRRQDVFNRPPRPFRFRAPPPASERPLMTQGYVRDSTEGLTFGRDGTGDRFRNLDDITDTDETDMDLSDNESQEPNDTDRVPSKRIRINELGDAAVASSKWSNPDPYTALPPVDQDSRKKTNVVNFIRKARNTASAAQKEKLAASYDDDFISFDVDDDQDAQTSLAPPDAPLGPRLGRHNVTSSTLGKRTRDEFEHSPLLPSKFGQQHHADARVLDWWRSSGDCDPTPWVRKNTSAADSAGVALHKEIIDFYQWVRPRDYEIAVRGSVLERLEQGLLRMFPGGKLEAFGSYAAGLYLPIGDMDLVFLERNFRPRAGPNGLPPKPAKRLFDQTVKHLKDQRMARPGSVQYIYGAKVPIIKFVENVSGLKIDLSFNNNTGVVANETFQTWREQYSAMPIITSIIKQYLMIRGLNDVASGGLGGFSVICLVTSLIQHMPLTSQPANLGQLLVEFFNLYGKLFNRQTVAIRLDPPGYLDVNTYRPFQFNHDKPDRLKIIDPNRPENNISGGSNKIGLIFQSFAQAYDILQERLKQHDDGNPVTSFLERLLGGNFESYDTQRDFLRDLYYGPDGQHAPAVILPAPPFDIKASSRPLPSITVHKQQDQVPVPLRTRSIAAADDSQASSLQNGIQTSVFESPRTRQYNQSSDVSAKGGSVALTGVQFRNTLVRFKKLRPPLAERAERTLNMRELAYVGGYGNVDIMLTDLDNRQTKMGSGVTNDLDTLEQDSEHDDSSPPISGTAQRLAQNWAARQEKAHQFRPGLSEKISKCTTKKQLAQLCGYQTWGEYSNSITNWEQEKGAKGAQPKIKKKKNKGKA